MEDSRLGKKRRAGVAAPLSFVQSKKSVGVGELPDLELLADWCRAAHLSIIQLLPMNDVGFDFRPYDSQSSLALEPMHLSPERMKGVPASAFAADIRALRKKFPLDSLRFDTRIKKEKLSLFRRMFDKRKPSDKDFACYRERESAWLEDYAVFKVIKEKTGYAGWESWPAPLRDRELGALERLRAEEKDALEFQAWLQWQLCEQFSAVKRAVGKKGVHLMGDLPFLVSRDSADVWSRPRYFKRHLSAGAPPDLYFADGQEWGMPPYDWQAMEEAGFDYLGQKLKYAENFYDLYRIDHFVGLFRVWAFPREGPEAERKKAGAFDPPDESQWEAHGEKILKEMLSRTTMLPCAEDLGTVPACSFRVLEKYSIPGMEIQRWMRDWGGTFDFKKAEEYRPNAIATLSTHDMSPFWAWWEEEAGTLERGVAEKKFTERGFSFQELGKRLFKEEGAQKLRWKPETTEETLLSALGRPAEEVRDFLELFRATADERAKFWKHVGMKGRPADKCSPELLRHALEGCAATRSIFSIQMLQDLLSLWGVMGKEGLYERINRPGTVDERNWRLRMPAYLEELKKKAPASALSALHKKTKRV